MEHITDYIAALSLMLIVALLILLYIIRSAKYEERNELEREQMKKIAELTEEIEVLIRSNARLAKAFEVLGSKLGGD